MVKTIIGFAVVLILSINGWGCAGQALEEDEPVCERSAYELERTRYRCTSAGELQTLECGEWETLDVCASPEACSPGPEAGCK